MSEKATLLRKDEELFTELAQSVLGRLTLTWSGETIALARPWRRLPFFTGISEALGIEVTPGTPGAVIARAAAARGES